MRFLKKRDPRAMGLENSVRYLTAGEFQKFTEETRVRRIRFCEYGAPSDSFDAMEKAVEIASKSGSSIAELVENCRNTGFECGWFLRRGGDGVVYGDMVVHYRCRCHGGKDD